MTIEDFWTSLREAAGSSAGSDATRWLRPRFVADYRPDDFAFLDEAARAELAAQVERFRTVAAAAPKRGSVPAEQVREGLAALTAILRLLPVTKFADADGFRTQVGLERELRGQLPNWVTGVACETRTDSLGEPAVYIWIEVTDEAAAKKNFGKKAVELDDLVREAYLDIGGRRWPYVRFRNPEVVTRKREKSV